MSFPRVSFHKYFHGCTLFPAVFAPPDRHCPTLHGQLVIPGHRLKFIVLRWSVDPTVRGPSTHHLSCHRHIRQNVLLELFAFFENERTRNRDAQKLGFHIRSSEQHPRSGSLGAWVVQTIVWGIHGIKNGFFIELWRDESLLIER
jgi:hypothetical protein